MQPKTSQLLMPFSPKGSLINLLVDSIYQSGYAVTEELFDAQCIQQLANEARQLQATGLMRKATTGPTAASETEKRQGNYLRGDSIFWIDESHATHAQQRYIEAMKNLQTALNQALFLGLFELESHFALYPAGGGYHKHLDQFQGDQSRQISSVLYLNHDWQVDDGGELRLYLNEMNEYIDVAPNGGKLVLFLSGQFLHEVLPAKRERASIAGWFRQRSADLV